MSGWLAVHSSVLTLGLPQETVAEAGECGMCKPFNDLPFPFVYALPSIPSPNFHSSSQPFDLSTPCQTEDPRLLNDDEPHRRNGDVNL